MAHRFRAIACLFAGAAVLGVSLAAQGRQQLTIDAIYDPQQRVDFNGAPPAGLRWLDNDTYIQTQRGAGWVKVDAASGRTSPLFDQGRMEAAVATLADITRDEAAAIARSNDLSFNPSRTGVTFTLKGDLYVYDFTSGAATRLTNAPGDEDEATFSPNGRLVAFVRSNNLYVVDIASQREQAITNDGGPQILNGVLDWLYQEEIYGRGRFRGYWWSPDSAHVAFLRLDEEPVPEYTIVDDIPYRPVPEITDYPKAGDPNPGVKLGIATVGAASPSWVDFSSYGTTDIIVVDVDWSPDARNVVYQVQDREQTWLDLNFTDVSSGHARRVLHETTPAWVNANGSATWLKDGSFLWFSESTGFKHLYHYKTDGSLVRRVTEGKWEVRTLYGVDEQRGVVYFDAGTRRHIDTDIYRVGLDGFGMTRISRTDGSHRASFNPSFTQYIDLWSDVTTPTQVRLHRADGSEARVIDANPVRTLTDYRLSTPEFLEVKARDGFVMDAMMIKPPDFNPTKKYPVYQLTYAGPTAASVRNSWGGTQYMYHQLLAQRGVIVWILDNRSAGGKGAEAQWPIYGKLGELELRDLEDGVAWLKRQPYIDASHIVMHGWSYGGFMTAYALTHSTSWSAGIAGAPVTDWRDYDTVYTERYMKTPKNNPDGYRSTAPRFAAANLHGSLLLIHGTIDDNVHTQNSDQLAYELQRAGKPFEMMVYPRSRHGITDPRLNLHLRQTMFDFILRVVS